MFLTLQELEELTGYKLHAWQRKWLDRQGWRYEVSANGRPVVSRDYANSRMSGPATKAKLKPVPNFAAIR